MHHYTHCRRAQRGPVSRALRMALVGGCGFAVVPIGLCNMQSTQLMTRFSIQEREGKLVKINLERLTPKDAAYRPQPRRMTSYAYSPRLLKAFRLFPKIQAVIDLVKGGHVQILSDPV